MERNRSLVKSKKKKFFFKLIILIINLDKKIMRLKANIFIHLFILFFSFNILEIKAHNNINGGCKDHCSASFNKSGNEKKIKIFKKDKKLIKEQNSCVNNSLCRG